MSKDIFDPFSERGDSNDPIFPPETRTIVPLRIDESKRVFAAISTSAFGGTPMLNTEEHSITISVKRWNELQEAEDKLIALETEGVEDWNGYTNAMELLETVKKSR